MFSNYGELGNEQLLFAFGFAQGNNPHEIVQIRLKGLNDFYPIDSSTEVPDSLWQALADMMTEELDKTLPLTMKDDTRYHHPDLMDCLLAYVENKLKQSQQLYPR